ncbi:hypothetical protein CHARACLAT_007782 [Characodon lateralis]|uniref:Uncharacterized protein n=1 Tax=Characodon lateralis TaxID=208331 RepID=A0ABU7F2D5_9TELE|nr:hypothetical protein [Characodon lateralis]
MMWEEHTADATHKFKTVNKIADIFCIFWREIYIFSLRDGEGEKEDFIGCRCRRSGTLMGVIVDSCHNLVAGGGGHRPSPDVLAKNRRSALIREGPHIKMGQKGVISAFS